MRGYMALSGREGAFGWSREDADGCITALGGLLPGGEYTLSSKERITADAQGRWQGRQRAALLFVSHAGQVILCDESRITWQEAALLQQTEKMQTPTPAAEKESKAQQEPVQYRTRLHAQPVDALPQLRWLNGCEKLRACFLQEKPVRVLPYPWRFVQVRGMGGEGLAGCLTERGCITKTAAAVRARGGLLQPRGLKGYEYVKTDTGEAYWMLIQSVR